MFLTTEPFYQVTYKDGMFVFFERFQALEFMDTLLKENPKATFKFKKTINWN